MFSAATHRQLTIQLANYTESRVFGTHFLPDATYGPLKPFQLLTTDWRLSIDFPDKSMMLSART